MLTWRDVAATIQPVDEQARAAAQARQLSLTKPPGALAVLEELGNQLCAIAGECPPPLPAPAVVCVFAADHGVYAQGVSPWPQEVSQQMLANVASGGAGINALAAAVGIEVRPYDVGLITPVDGVPGIRSARVAAGTSDMTVEPSLGADRADAVIEAGLEAGRDAVADGFRCLLTGEVGIGNTTAAAALIAAYTNQPAGAVTGRGAGAGNEMLARKTAVVDAALTRHQEALSDPFQTLAALGGLEHAATVGLILAAAQARIPVIIDGVIGCSAALAAAAICPATLGYVVAGHAGAEPGIALAHAHAGLSPVVDLGLRLGEGTGAALAWPALQAAAHVLRDMATFESAGVAEDHDEA